MGAKYTKGPWRADVYTGGEFPGFDIYAPVQGREDTVERVANMGLANTWITVPEMVANASLIAAAPELLEALEELSSITEDLLLVNREPEPWSIGDKVRRAIAKAHGGAK